MRVAQIAGHEQCHDLAPSAWKRLVAAGETFQNEMNDLGSLALSHDILSCFDAPSMTRDVDEQGTIPECQVGPVLQFGDQRVGHVVALRNFRCYVNNIS